MASPLTFLGDYFIYVTNASPLALPYPDLISKTRQTESQIFLYRSLLVVVVFTRYFEGLLNTIGKIDAASRINEDVWLEEVIKGLNLASYNCADDLQKETGEPYTKYHIDGTKAYDLDYGEAPPTRLLAMTLILSYWLGWLDASKTHNVDSEPVAAWRRIKEAYEKGKTDYK